MTESTERKISKVFKAKRCDDLSCGLSEGSNCLENLFKEPCELVIFSVLKNHLSFVHFPVF